MTMVTNPRCRVIQASEFKARCLALMDEAAATGEVFVITKNGKPVAELRAYQGERAPSPFGLHPDTKILGDIISPLDPADWNVLA